MELNELRDQLNQIDNQLADLFCRRMAICQQVAQYKIKNNLPVLDQSREDQVIARLCQGIPPREQQWIKQLYHTVFSISKDEQQTLLNASVQGGRYGLLGCGLGHSYSPWLHQTLWAKQYELFSVEQDQLADILQNRQIKGFNVTMPYKRQVMPYCASIDPKALQIGCVNTLVRDKHGALHGYHTDYSGFAYLLNSAGISPRQKKVVVLGSGATAGTVCCVLRDMGAGQVVQISRTGQNNYQNLVLHADADLLINTTPVGMYPNTDKSPVDLRVFDKLQGVVDVVYNPLRTKLLLQAKSLGIPCVGGLGMLVGQAICAAQLFGQGQWDSQTADKLVQQLTKHTANIVFVGMPGSGKTSIARVLARRLNRPFMDVDEMVEQQCGMSIARLFDQQGEEAFRRLEQQVLQRACSARGAVIATGGGSVLKRENRQTICQNGVVVWVQRDLHCLETNGRPLSAGYDQLRQMYAYRLPLDRQCSDIQIQNNGTIEQAVCRIQEEWI